MVAGPDLVTERSATGRRDAVAVSSLSAGTSSRPPEPLNPVFVTVVAEGSVATIRVAVAVAPTLRRPRLHDAAGTSSTWSSWQVPWLAVNETNVVPAGIGSERLALGATVGPLLTSVSRYSSGWPATGSVVTSSLVSVTSAWAMASTVAVAVSFDGSGSPVVEVTDAVLVSAPGWSVSGTLSTMSRATLLPAARLPRAQVIVPAPLAVHPVGSVATVVPAGIDSVSTAPAASDGPSLVTVSV